MEQPASFRWPPAMTCKRKKEEKKKRNEKLFIILFLQKGPEAVRVTSATFLCCTPATNTDVAGPRAGCFHFVYLGCKASENLPLSYTNGHLILCWELHSRCLFCISNIDFCNLFNFLRLRSVSFRNVGGFFLLTKVGFRFPNFLFVTQTMQLLMGPWKKGRPRSWLLLISHLYWCQPLMQLKTICKVFLIVIGTGDEKQEPCFSQWFTLPAASQAFPKTF